MRTFVLILAVAALLPVCAAAQNVSAIVQGTIQDFSSKAPLTAVHVRAVSTSGQVTATSDSKGFFTLWNVPLGQVTISFNHSGYIPMSGKMCIHPGMKRDVDIRLSKNPGSQSYEHWLKSRTASGLMQPANVTTLANC
jgi:hypothetical protein